MTEQQNPEQTTTEQPAAPAPAPAPDVVEAARTEARAVATEVLAPIVETATGIVVEAPRYAAYDTTYGRFLPGTFATEKGARDAAKAHKFPVGRVSIRDVNAPVQASRTPTGRG